MNTFRLTVAIALTACLGAPVLAQIFNVDRLALVVTRGVGISFQQHRARYGRCDHSHAAYGAERR